MTRLLFLLLLSFHVKATVYYVDAKFGKDTHQGRSEIQAWKTLERVDKHSFQAGDVLLFRAGQSWQGQVWFKGEGEEGKPIKVGKYGEGALPRIDGGGAAYTLKIYNSSYWEVRDLEITNYSAEEEGGITLAMWEKRNVDAFVNKHLPEKAVRDVSMKLGIYVGAKDRGKVSHIYLQNVVVHGVNGNIVPDGADENGASKHNGGIGFQIDGSEIPTWWEDVLIENCLIRDVDRTGLFFKSSWETRTADSPGNWTPSKNVKIRNTIFRRTGANAIIVRVAESPLMEYNLFDYCAIKGSGNAAFSFNTDGAIWQYNECRFTKANAGDNDAGGLDSDYRSKGTVIQYNYLHHNDFGLLVTGGGGNFNLGSVVRYNLIQEDGKEVHQSDKRRFAIKVSGGAENTRIHDNSITIGHDSVHAIFHKKWKVWPKETLYENNWLAPFRGQVMVSLGESVGNDFKGNHAVGGYINVWFSTEAAMVKNEKQPTAGNLKSRRIGPALDQSGAGSEEMLYLDIEGN
jgi:hypothetical protein